MTNKEKIEFFDKNSQLILNHPDNKFIEAMVNELKNEKLVNLLKRWPNEIKILIVDRYMRNKGHF